MLWVVLMEMKVSQVGCFQIMGSWIWYLIFPCFSRDFCQKLYEKTFCFQIKFQKSISRWGTLQKIRMSNFVILKWQTIEYKIKNWHLSFFGVVLSQIKNVDILNFLWIKYFGNDFPFLMKWHIWVSYCWNYGPSKLESRTESKLLIVNWYIF